MECFSCGGAYSKPVHQPRNLPCGHVCCHSCLWEMVAGFKEVECPKCQDRQDIRSMEGLPICWGLLDAIKMLEDKREATGTEPAGTETAGTEATGSETSGEVAAEMERTNLSSQHGSTFSFLSQDSVPLMVPVISDGQCDDHGYYKVFYCEFCGVWVCRDCTLTEHTEAPCLIVSNKQGLTMMKSTRKTKIEQEFQHCVNKITALEDLVLTFEFSLDELMVLLSRINIDLDKKRACNARFHQDRSQLEANLRQIIEANTIQDIREILQDQTAYEEHKKGDREHQPESEVEEERMWIHCDEAAKIFLKLSDVLKDFEGTGNQPEA